MHRANALCTDSMYGSDVMIYRIGTKNELNSISLPISECVFERLQECIEIFDDAYGENRDYSKKGGYVIVAENYDDVLSVKDILDYDNRLCEWVDKVSDYIIAKYLISDDYAIVVAMPVDVAPDIILNELRGDF